MGQNNCTKNQTLFNATNPCFIDTSNNRVWIRLPHFSGTKPSIIGNVITATTQNSGGSSSGGGSGSIVSKWVKEIKLNGSALNLGQTLKELKTNYRLTFNVSGLGHYVGITNITNTTVTIEVASTPQTATLRVGETKKFDVNADGYYDLSVSVGSITYPTTSLVLSSINEKIVASTSSDSNGTVNTDSDIELAVKSSSKWWLVPVIIIVVVIVILFIFLRRKK